MLDYENKVTLADKYILNYNPHFSFGALASLTFENGKKLKRYIGVKLQAYDYKGFLTDFTELIRSYGITITMNNQELIEYIDTNRKFEEFTDKQLMNYCIETAKSYLKTMEYERVILY